MMMRSGAARAAAATHAAASARRAASSAVALDVDGVLVRGGATVASAPGALAALTAASIPFLFMTNGGGHDEAARAAQFASRFGVGVAEWQICQSHTPMRLLAREARDGVALLVGKNYPSLEAIAASYGFAHYVTVEDLHRAYPLLYPDAAPAAGEAKGGDWRDREFSAILALTDPLLWGRELQIVCDVARSTGTARQVGEGGREPAAAQTVPVYSGCADFLYAAEHPAPRFGAGASLLALKALYADLAGSPLAVVDYGKPHGVSYDYAARILAENGSPPGAATFMIGDNPLTDIAGAKRAGAPWKSILVKGGMWRDGDDTGGADFVVDDVAAAVDVVLAHDAAAAAAGGP